MTVKDYDLAKEVLMILPYIDKEYLIKIPQDFINNLVDLASLSNKDFTFEKGENFKEMAISNECKDFLAMLVFNESNIEERKNLLNIWNYNEINNN